MFRGLFWVLATAFCLLTIWYVWKIYEVKSGNYSYFVYAPNQIDRYEINIGPNNLGKYNFNSWTSLEEVPYYCIEMLLMSEDPHFFYHNGINIRGIWYSLKANIRMKKLYYGASTISQQLVKNLFLWRDKSIVRKGIEIQGAALLDLFLNKQQQMAWYLNIVELGPYIYGIGPAADYYFDKAVSELKPEECATLIGMLSEPVHVHEMIMNNEFSVFTFRKSAILLLSYLKRLDSLKTGVK